MDTKSIASKFILQILSKRSPELGARLKQQLNLKLVDGGFDRLNEKAYGYKKFSDFLESALDTQILVERPEGNGDIVVSLRHPSSVQSPSPVSIISKVEDQLPVIRSEIWQAFTNPDPQRKRFLHKETRTAHHYLETEDSSTKVEIQQRPDDFLEIEAIPAEIQLSWMLGFLESLKLLPSAKAPLETMLTGNYSSGLNATFTRALGEKGTAWRHYRTNKIIEMMRAWSVSRGIRFDDLCARPDIKEPIGAQSNIADVQLTARQQAVALLERLSEDDIARSVIPSLVSLFLIKTQA